MFGWGVALSAGLLALAQQRGIVASSDTAPWWLVPLLSVALAFVLVVGCNALLLAPYRAWRMLHPFRIEVVAGNFPGVFPKLAFPRQSATLLVTNLSYRQREGCVLHVMSIAGFNNQHHALPHFVQEFTLQPGDTRQLEFLTWTARTAPSGSDPCFMVSGPVAWGWDGSVVQLPVDQQSIILRIGIPNADAVAVACHVWVEGKNLRAAGTNPAPILRQLLSSVYGMRNET